MDEGILIWVLHPGHGCLYCRVTLGFDAGLCGLLALQKLGGAGVTRNRTDIGADIDQGCRHRRHRQMGSGDDVADGGAIAVLRKWQAERQ